MIEIDGATVIIWTMKRALPPALISFAISGIAETMASAVTALNDVLHTTSVEAASNERADDCVCKEPFGKAHSPAVRLDVRIDFPGRKPGYARCQTFSTSNRRSSRLAIFQPLGVFTYVSW